ncbi:MAG: serine/threonine-protein phosphatase [Lachnospiraceae bacterium]|nr:serine/threonine-protein phosphatase [Lachnospiraceae bacterium]
MKDGKKESVNVMGKQEVIRHSLSAKTYKATVISCIVFGLVAEIVAMVFYATSHTKEIISVADSVAHQTMNSAIHGTDARNFSKQVLDVYFNLSEEERKTVGTEAYRAHFADLGLEVKGGTADVLYHMFAGNVEQYDVYDIYIGMYDEKNSALIYVVDADLNEATRFKAGDWEDVSPKEIKKFLNWNGEGEMYDIEWTKKYGLLCTVGQPIRDENGLLIAFMLVDVSVENVLVGMWEFVLQLTIALILVTLLLAWLQTKRINRVLVDPINKIAEASVEYANDRKNGQSGMERFSGLNIHTGDEIENLSLAMADMERELAEYEANLTKITAEKERIGVELSLATKIQASMLPHVFPPFPNRSEFDLYASMEPAREVGGDFYDFFLVDEDHLCLVIADVSGKGIPAALFMMISKTILQSVAMLGNNASQILKRTNEALSSNDQVQMFVTAWLGILEISTGKLTTANAGHEYPILKRADGKFEFVKDIHGFVIGGDPDSEYKEYEIQMHAGDKLFVYTDGVTEAMDAEGEMFGNDRLLEALNQKAEASPTDIIDQVRSSVKGFVKDAEQFDDLTMLCFEYTKKD